MTTSIMSVQTTDRWRRSGVVLVLVLLLGIGGCTAWLAEREPGADAAAGHDDAPDDVLAQVNDALLAAGLTEITAAYDADGNIVLTGTVPTDDQRTLAELFASQVPGVGQIINLIEVVAPEPQPETEPEPEPEPEPEVALDASTLEFAFGADGAITLIGVVADDGTVASIEAQLQAQFPEAAIDNQLTVGDVDPELVAISVTGEARTSADAQGNAEAAALIGEAIANDAAVEDLQTVRNTDDEISFETALNDLVTKEPIVFATGSAELSAESTATLDKAVALFLEEAGVPVEVGGHTDDQGGRDGNVALSQARADAVRNYLIDKGIEGARLTTAGYGPDRPTASNDTAAGQAQNRRIEFTVNP